MATKQKKSPVKSSAPVKEPEVAAEVIVGEPAPNPIKERADAIRAAFAELGHDVGRSADEQIIAAWEVGRRGGYCATSETVLEFIN